MAGEVVGDDVEVARRIVGFEALKQSDVVRRVARGGASGQFLAIAHTQRSLDPGFLGTATVIQRCFDAMSIGRPAGCWGKGAGNYWLKSRRCRWSSTPWAAAWSGRRPLSGCRQNPDRHCRPNYGCDATAHLRADRWLRSWADATPASASLVWSSSVFTTTAPLSSSWSAFVHRVAFPPPLSSLHWLPGLPDAPIFFVLAPPWKGFAFCNARRGMVRTKRFPLC